MNDPQEPVFLPEVAKAMPPGAAGDMMRGFMAAGQAAPQIYHLFAYKPDRAQHLGRYTEAVMRGPSPLEPWKRELIAAYTSKLNQCDY